MGTNVYTILILFDKKLIIYVKKSNKNDHCLCAREICERLFLNQDLS